jgi:hypothetical protein
MLFNKRLIYKWDFTCFFNQIEKDVRTKKALSNNVEGAWYFITGDYSAANSVGRTQSNLWSFTVSTRCDATSWVVFKDEDRAY